MSQQNPAAIRQIAQTVSDQRGAKREGLTSSPARPGLFKAVVTGAASTTGPYEVALLNADGTASSATFFPVLGFPNAETEYEVDEKVWVYFQNPGEPPDIIQATLGSASEVIGGGVGIANRFFSS